MRSLLGRFHRPNARSQTERLFMLNNLGDGSTLNLDFTTMTATADLTARGLTFTRGSTGTRINASGFVETMSNNVARFDHDPTTLAPKGLLLEGQATNLLNWSASFATSGGTNNNWADTSITRTTGQADPANGTTAIRFTASAGNATVISTAAIGTSAQRTFSIWLRRVTGTGNIQFTTDNGATWTTQAITAFWVRYTFAATTAAQRVGIRIVTSADAIEMWGAQLETGSGASSYIPTGASQATRIVDICTMSNIAALNYNANGGTLFAHFSNNTENANFAGSIGFNNGANYAQRLRWGSGSLTGSYFQTNGTTTLGSNLGGSRTSFASAKAATSYSFDGTTTSTAMSINGAQATTTPTSSAVSGVSIATAFALNSDNSSATTDYPSIAVRSVKFYPFGMTMAQMNAITVTP
jgi:hypothetical protein